MKTRYPTVIEKGKCRGCGKPVPKGRHTWCSDACWLPHTAVGRHQVLKRDKVCQLCGDDILGKINGFNQAVSNWFRNYQDGPKPQRPRYEIDHIVPFSEGGKTTFENLRLLCVPCHKKRTAEWRKTRTLVNNNKKET